jgi:hypothetical protein
MGDRHKNFEDPINWTRDIRRIKFDLLGFFGPPFNIVFFLLIFIISLVIQLTTRKPLQLPNVTNCIVQL